ncbi:unnamed protein product [Camellia sinensis]
MLLELTTLFGGSSIEKSIWNVLVSANKRRQNLAKGPPTQRKPLKLRDYEVDLESRLGKTQCCYSNSTPKLTGRVLLLSVCVKDFANYLDHINGKKHQRALGMSMRVEQASLEQVQERFELLKKRKDTGPCTEQASKKRKKGSVNVEREKEKKRRQQRRKTEVDADVAAMIGYGGFGSSKKYKVAIMVGGERVNRDLSKLRLEASMSPKN